MVDLPTKLPADLSFFPSCIEIQTIDRAIENKVSLAFMAFSVGLTVEQSRRIRRKV